MTTTVERDGPRHVSVLVVGAGFAGLGAAIRLQQAGRKDVLVIERGNDVGGTWRENTYPGAACDVPSQLYSYSFARNPGWSRSFSPQPEIQAYLQATAERCDVTRNILFDCELLAARWDAGQARWQVSTSQGAFSCDILVTAFGALCEPSVPPLPGIESFRGNIFHSSRWDHDQDLAGRRVALIGTGASAIQIIPAIVDTVGHLDVYQRTAPWVMPRSDRAYTRAERWAFRRLPGFQRLCRALVYALREATAVGFCYRPGLLAAGERQAGAHLKSQVGDPALRARLTPTFRLGCKRVLLSDDYYPAITREQVELVTDPIREILPHAIVTGDGTVREVDVLVVATGFHVSDSPAADLLHGTDGRTMGEHWRQDGQQAYKGTTAAAFPNCFMLVGPNTGLGHSSMIYMIESQLNYLLDALDVMDREGIATIEVKKELQDNYNDDLQRRMSRTVWTGGCASWYLDAHGRNTTLWPGFTFEFRRRTRRFDAAAYTTTSRVTRTRKQVAA
jgi:cation diffusion facilitator CzcD-associated flavoprotein CzcO